VARVGKIYTRLDFRVKFALCIVHVIAYFDSVHACLEYQAHTVLFQGHMYFVPSFSVAREPTLLAVLIRRVLAQCSPRLHSILVPGSFASLARRLRSHLQRHPSEPSPRNILQQHYYLLHHIYHHCQRTPIVPPLGTLISAERTYDRRTCLFLRHALRPEIDYKHICPGQPILPARQQCPLSSIPWSWASSVSCAVHRLECEGD
jgi:hypothetical protein